MKYHFVIYLLLCAVSAGVALAAPPVTPMPDSVNWVVVASSPVPVESTADASALRLAIPAGDTTGGQLYFNQLTVWNGLPGTGVTALTEDAAGYIWIGTSGGLCRFDGYQVQVFDENVLKHSRNVSQMCTDGTGRLWIAFSTCDELCCLPAASDVFEWYPRDQVSDSLRRALAAPAPSHLERGRWGWTIDEQTRVLYQTDTLLHDTLYYVYETAAQARLDDPCVQLMYLDSKDVLWIGSEVGGVYYADINRRQRKHYQFGPPGTVLAMCRDQSGCIYMSIKNLGIVCMDGDCLSWHVVAGIPSGHGSPEVVSMLSDRQGRLWLGTSDGVMRWQTASGVLTWYRPRGGTTASATLQVKTIVEDSDGRIWLGSAWGIMLYQSEKDIFTRYGSDFLPPVHRICFLPDHALWAGTSAGIYLLPDATQTIQISDKICTSMDVDAQGVLWFGTKQGLFGLTRDGGVLRDFSFAPFLQSDAVKSVRCVGNALWISHSCSISCLQTDVFSMACDELETSAKAWHLIETGNAYSEDACCFDDRTGDLYFGGVSGVDMISSHRPPENPFLPHPVMVRKEGNTFDFSALHFTAPTLNRYAYRLWPLHAPKRDTLWRVMQLEDHLLQLGALRAGQYELQMRAANCDGLWNPEPAVCQFQAETRRPVWLTGWHLGVLISALLLMLTAAFVRLRHYALRIRQEAMDKWLQPVLDPAFAVEPVLHTDVMPADTSDAEVPMGETSADTPGDNSETEFMRCVVETVLAHLGHPDFSVNELADAMRIGRSTLCKKLNQEHITVSRLIREIRLKSAAELLRENPDMPLNEVSSRCGFRDYSNFWRSFSSRYGVSPSKFAAGDHALPDAVPPSDQA